MSFFGSNPFATQCGQLIEAATDGSQASENWSAFMDICDLINEREDGPKDAIKAIKKRLTTSTGKNYTVVIYTLTLLETCVKNCGKRFHIQVAQKDFLQDLIKIIGPKNDPPQVVQEKVLSLIQTWADAFQGQPDLKEVCKVYQDLKHKGIEFPMTDLDSMAPIHTPARSAPGEDPAPRPPQRAPAPTRGTPTHHVGSPSQRPAPVNPAMVAQQPQMVPAGPMVPTPDQLAKLRSEFDIVQQNCKVFSEMLTEMSSGQEHPSDVELLMELNRTCRQMQQRLVELVERVQNEEVTGEILHINDELNNVFLRFDRYERLRGGAAYQNAAQTTPAQPAAATPQLPPPYPAQAQTANTDQSTGNLIDLETPSPQPQPKPVYAQQPLPPIGAANAGDLSAQLAGMNMGSNSVSSTLGQLNTTVATNSASPSAGGGDDEFDMFAQSRQNFDANKQANTGSAYGDQNQDQYSGGLGAAVTAKSTGVPQESNPQPMQGKKSRGDDDEIQLDDKEGDYNEMESWLESNTAPGATESATSSEFDHFLAERAREAESLPDANPNVRGGRQLQKDGQDDALFAL